MKKVFLIFLVTAAAVFLLHHFFSMFQPEETPEKQVVHIAIAGPMGEKNGQEMLKGASLYLDEIKKQGRFENMDIQITPYDDVDKQTAVKIATRIADENQAVIVLGHYRSTNSIAAGNIYKKKGIPALTASATADDVTQDNNWFFRSISHNADIAQFAAEYMKKALNISRSSLVYSNDAFGRSISETFQPKAKEMGITIPKQVEINIESETLHQDIKNITGNLRAFEDLGMIFCASDYVESAQFFSTLRYPGTNYPVMGPDLLATPGLISQLNLYDREQENPGYYSDGIYAVSHFFAELSGQKGLDFQKEFIKKYGHPPSWIAACYYDAMLVAMTAIERAEISGENIMQDRKKVREALTRFDQPDMAVNGITGDIFFNKNGDALKPLYMGVWHKQRLLPAFWQYRDMPVLAAENNKTDDDQTDENITLDGRALHKTRLVYTGIDINEIKHIDTISGIFTADFYLWFRFKGTFDDTDIMFTNAVQPVKLGDPVETFGQDDDITTRAYRVIADFKMDADKNILPVDDEILRISLRHGKLPETELIYIPDTPGYPPAALNISAMKKTAGNIESRMTGLIPGWHVKNISFQPEIANTTGTDTFSKFNAEIRITRGNIKSVFVKSLFPFFVMIILLYSVYLIPPKDIALRFMIFTCFLVVVMMFHYAQIKLMPLYQLFSCLFYGVYLSVMIALLVSGGVYIANKKSWTLTAGWLNFSGICIHGALTIGLTVFIIYRYMDYQPLVAIVSDKISVWYEGMNAFISLYL